MGNSSRLEGKECEQDWSQCNRSVANKRNDGEITRSEAENAERESRDACLHEYRKTMPSIMS